MNIDDAFDQYQRTVNADPAQVNIARQRRDTFKAAFRSEGDVAEVFGSGSLARSTQLKPIHDVDLVAVFEADKHPGWGDPGGSAEESLRHVQERVISLLGMNGSVASLVRETRAAGRNRAVKCFIDPPDQDDAFHVDVMPALRQADGTLLIPSTRDQEWQTANPEYLIQAVADRQSDWRYFRPIVRLLKDWRLDLPVAVKSLVIEVLALKCLPTDRSRAEALRSFFAAAAVEVNFGVVDPAGHCGPIQADLDTEGLRAALLDASRRAELACEAAGQGSPDEGLRHWQSIFGADFPAPEKAKVNPLLAAPAAARPRPVKDAPQG